MFQIVTEAPAWFLLFCVAAGAGAVLLLYRNKSALQDIKPALRWLMMGLRFFSVTLIAFLLLSPLIKTQLRFSEKPIILIAQDNSESIVSARDSSFYKSEYAEKMRKVVSDLSGKFDVKTLSFSDRAQESLDFSFTGKQTDISGLLDETDTRYANRNVGAIILASDGLYNKGTNPLFHTGPLRIPVYTLALGDTTEKKDLLLGNIRFNKVAYLGNTFPVEVTVEARQSSGAASTLSFYEDSVLLFSRPITVSGGKFRQVIPFYPEAVKKGNHHYRIMLTEIPGEVTGANNVKDIYIDVQESRRKILIVADGPHPDIAALKQAIESNENYEVKAVMIDRFEERLNDEQLVILHQLPSVNHPAEGLLKQIREKSISAFYILGSRSGIQAFNSLDAGVSIRNGLNKGNIIQPEVNVNFSMFTLAPEAISRINAFPPLLAPFGEYRASATGSSLLYQLIGSVQTDQPLLFLGETADTKTGVLCGEGIWRWRLQDYQLHGTFAAFDELVSRPIQYLTTRETKSRFKVFSKTSFNENEPVVLNAEVYNESYELTNVPDVSITINSKADNHSFPFNFSKTEKAYTLNAGMFSPGQYRYQARVKLNDKQYTAEGSFTVTALQVERYETVADHQLLYSLSEKTGGQMFYPSGLDDLVKVLTAREDLKTVTYSQLKLIDLVNLKALFFILLFLLAIEWFLRKRNGGY